MKQCRCRINDLTFRIGKVFNTGFGEVKSSLWYIKDMGKLFTRDANILATNYAFEHKSTNRKVGIKDSNQVRIIDLINCKESSPSHIIKEIS